MSFRDLLFDTLRTLWAHKLRTFLTMFGIAWGIVSITLMVAAGEGLRVGQQRVSENFGKNIMIVFPGRTSMQAGGTRAGRATEWQATDHVFIQSQAPACGVVLPELGNSLTVRSLYNSGTLTVVASLPPFAEVRTIPVAEGRFYNDEDAALGRRVAFLGSDAKKQLFASRPALGETIHIGDYPYVVIGVMQSKEQDSSYDGRDISKVFIPFNAALRDFPRRPPSRPTAIDRFIVTPKSIADHETCKWELRRALARLHNFDPRDEEAAKIWDTVETAKAFEHMTQGMKIFLGAVGLISLLLGGIGVTNVMLVAVRERTREIGVRKAVGATGRAILSQFFVETIIIVFLSGGIGLGITFGLCALVNSFPMPPFFAGLVASWESAILALALLGTVAVLSALYPANRAASVDPIEALRYEAGG
ncbi:MAG TPA: ABC transporter permease [Bryobacteraceae bacterium]|nr:ABC transporter permease [Bryobacteraceae bacterium]HOL73340.1 ABC transporter permease [Bryobacteraceae bacterium]HOQ46512.1 ABC transporter permease [Bryobacteraceae bacterium]HPQ14207.1 ABC transporter permease [Bryobacteraceae bacterium]HPU72670.1 ABC transporter permease [Bryobacteraceae bacterium]